MHTQWDMGLRLSQTYKLQRLAALLLLGALITYALWLIGLATRSIGFSVSYGSRAKAANTLSIMSLAMHWINDTQRPSIHQTQIRHALIELISMVRVCEMPIRVSYSAFALGLRGARGFFGFSSFATAASSALPLTASINAAE